MPDRYDDTSTSVTPSKLEYRDAQEQATASYPKATGRPSAVQSNDPATSPRVTVSTKQSGNQSTPGKQDSWPSKVDSYEEGTV